MHHFPTLVSEMCKRHALCPRHGALLSLLLGWALLQRSPPKALSAGLPQGFSTDFIQHDFATCILHPLCFWSLSVSLGEALTPTWCAALRCRLHYPSSMPSRAPVFRCKQKHSWHPSMCLPAHTWDPSKGGRESSIGGFELLFLRMYLFIFN